MNLSTRSKIALAVLLIVASAAIGFAITSEWTATSGVHFNATDGPEVHIGEDIQLEVQQPFPDADTVDLYPNGNLTSDGPTEVTINGIGDETTSLSDIDASDTTLWIDLADKHELGVDGDINSLDYDEGDPGENVETHLSYNAPDAWSVTVGDLTEGDEYLVVDSSGALVDSDIADSEGRATFELDEGSDDLEIQLAPGNLEIRDEQTQELIDDQGEVTARFFIEGADLVETRSTTNGTVDLSGLPSTQEFVVLAQVDGYENRRIVIENLFEQNTIYLLPDDADSVLSTFLLDDRTQDFPTDETKLFIERPLPDPDGEGQTYQVIAGDYFGADGEFPVFLEAGERYRITVENDDGQTRSLGSYIPETDDIVELSIGEIQVNIGTDDSWTIDAETIIDDEQSEIRVSFLDRQDITESVEFDIVERGNESNVLQETVTITDPEEFQETILLSEEEQDTPWEVRYEVVRGDETHTGTIPVGAIGGFDWPVGGPWMQAFGLFAIVGTASLFGGSMSRTGALMACFVAFGLTILGVLTIPSAALILAGVVAIAFRVAEQSDQGGFI